MKSSRGTGVGIGEGQDAAQRYAARSGTLSRLQIIHERQERVPDAAQNAGKRGAKTVAGRCEGMAKNMKNNKTNPFPCNRKEGMPLQRIIADFGRQIGRQSPSILIFL